MVHSPFRAARRAMGQFAKTLPKGRHEVHAGLAVRTATEMRAGRCPSRRAPRRSGREVLGDDDVPEAQSGEEHLAERADVDHPGRAVETLQRGELARDDGKTFEKSWIMEWSKV